MVDRKRIAMRDHSAESILFQRRAIVSLIAVVVAMVVLLSNMYSLQVVSHDDYQTRSNDNRIRVLPVAPNRGLIYDRNGVLLAENRPVYSLEIVPEEVSDLEETVQRVGDLLAIEKEAQESFFEQVKFSRRFKRVPLKNRLNEEEVAKFSVHQHEFPGVYIEANLARHYPYGEILTHMLGFVSKINKKEMERLDKQEQTANYRATRHIGKQGIEKYYEQFLHGKVGYQEVEVNNRGRIIRTLNSQPPEPGQDLYLNIDISLQMLGHQEMAGRRGAIVMMDPTDGSVIAMVSSPSYDPNLFVHGISSKNYRELLNSKDRPLINRATQGRYPPASTIKPHIALLGLEEKYITPQSKIWDPGWYQPKNVERRFRDWKKWGHGWVDVYVAIEQSCDTYFYELAQKLGIDKISQFMNLFGFGEFSGIDIYEETKANMPSRDWKRLRYNQPWYLGDTISIGIGQSYWTTTLIQLAQSTSILATRGERYTPRLLHAFQTQSGVMSVPHESHPPIQLKNETNWDVILNAMHGVNHNVTGTAKQVFKTAWYESAGKTGTAQIIGIAEDEEYDAEKLAEKHRDNAMYIGFAPYRNPKVVVAVAVENAGGGSSNAAPIARKLIDSYLSTLPFDGDFKTTNGQVP